MHYSFKSTPTYTFKSRNTGIHINNEVVTTPNQACSRPGPADYKVKKPLHQSGTIANTREERNLYKPFDTNPGPGQYQRKSHITDGPKRSMSARYVDYSKKSPGPPDYNNDTLKVKGKQPVFTMSTRSKSYQTLTKELNSYKPAPTSYESKTSFDKKHGAIIGKDARKDLTETEKTPAPNHYQRENADQSALVVNPRCLMGKEFRKTDFSQGEKTPGPAFYAKRSFIEENKDKKKGYSCRNKNDDLIALEISKYPGPGMYESHLGNKNSAPRYAPPQNKRSTFMDDMQNFKKVYPSPGSHDPGFVGTKYRSTSACQFTKSNRRPLDENEKTPGPFEYQNKKNEVMNSAPRYSGTRTVGKQEFLGVNPENPGPGTYDANVSLVKEGSKVWEVPKQKRPDFEKHRKTPGPGYYNLRGKQAGPTWGFSTEKRIAFTDNKNEGKDGQHYDIPSKVVDPPKYMRVESKVKYSNSSSKNAFRSTGLSQ